MKNLIAIILISLFAYSANAQTIYSQSEEGLLNKDYESFGFLDVAKPDPDTKEAMIINNGYIQGVLVYLDPEFPTKETKNKIKDAIKHELISKDYKIASSNPDLLVTFMVFSEDGKVKGDFKDDGAFIDDTEEIQIKDGSLLISMIDTNSGEVVWSGVNDGIFNGKNSIEESDSINAVVDILDALDIG